MAQSSPAPRRIPVREVPHKPVPTIGVLCAAPDCDEAAVAIVNKQVAVCGTHHWVLESHLTRLGVSLSEHLGSVKGLLLEAIERARSQSARVVA